MANLRGARRTEQRGYLLTGEPAYRAAYQRSTGSSPRTIADLKRRDPSLRGRIEALDPLVADVIRELDRGIEVRDKSGVEAAIANIRGGRTSPPR